uniref:Uncharacterized protein n=1 Tax=Pithovirus LCDPAC02 TaxID=2506601 RepID=A0A481YPJ5_9VIRU|nr:MAG: hypothetical protein LCDPAC02_03670 [Pithovirus LCDPAC02]
MSYETKEDKRRYDLIVKNISFCWDSMWNTIEDESIEDKEKKEITKKLVFDLWEVFGKHDMTNF